MDRESPFPARIDLLGFFVHPGSLEDYLRLTHDSVQSGTPITVLYHNLHSLYSYFTSASLRNQYQQNIVLVDGMPIVWLLKLFGFSVTREHRVTYVDFIMPLMKLASEKQLKVFHLGQTSDVQQQAMLKIRQACPNLVIDGRDGYFDQTPHSEESLAVVDRINAAACDILLVGFGAPRQEAWVHAHRSLINASVVFTCGACMEYVAGSVRTPPRWMGKLGLEWSFRLFENPRRFAFRYLVEPIALAFILCRNAIVQWMGRKQPSP